MSLSTTSLGSPPESAVRGRLEWCLLGPLECRIDGIEVGLGPARERAVALLLLANAGHVVAMASIVDALWPDEPPAHAVNIVHRTIGALRRVVEPGLRRREQGSWLLSEAGGYRVQLPDEALDLARFRRKVEQARGEVTAHARLELVLDALSEWRGAAAADLPHDLRIGPILDSLDREQADAAVSVVADALELGAASRLLPALTLSVRHFPTDELVYAALLRCLASAGQRARALELYDEFRSLLVDELGVEPGPALKKAHLAVLRDEDEAQSLGRPLPLPAQLPIRVVDVVGRNQEWQRLRDLCRSPSHVGPVLVTGTGGVGKTTLVVGVAHEVAQLYPDGQLYVDLRGFDSSGPAATPREVLARFLEGLDISATKIPDDLEARAALYRSALAQRRALVILDNAHDSDQVRPLLPGSGGSRVVLTSRRQLRGITSEGSHVIALRAFDPEESAAFLRNRLGPERVTDRTGVEAMTAASGGLPLALAILAARAAHDPQLSLAAISMGSEAARGLDQFADPDVQGRDVRSVLSGSYDALCEDAARLLRRLALYPARSIAAPYAADLLGGTEGLAREGLAELCDASLVVEESPGRFSWHDLVNRFVAELSELESADQRRATKARLAGHLVADAVAAARSLSPDRHPLPGHEDWNERPGDAAWADGLGAPAWFDAEWPTVLGLVEQASSAPADDRVVWSLAWAVAHYLDRRGLWREMRACTAAGVRAADRSGAPVLRAMMRREAARAQTNLGETGTAAELVSTAIHLLLEADDAPVPLVADTYRQLAWIREQQGDYAGALDAAQQAAGRLDVAEYQQDPRLGFALNALGWYEAHLGRLDSARLQCERALALLGDRGHSYGRADTYSSLGLVAARSGRTREAIGHYGRAVRLYRGLGVRHAAAEALLDLGELLVDVGRPGLGRPFASAAADILDDLHHDRAGVAHAVAGSHERLTPSGRATA